jgi:hypothetical protein
MSNELRELISEISRWIQSGNHLDDFDCKGWAIRAEEALAKPESEQEPVGAIAHLMPNCILWAKEPYLLKDSSPLYTHPTNIRRLDDSDEIDLLWDINNGRQNFAQAIMDACNIPK